MKNTNTLNSLNVSLEDLYKGKKQININLSDKPYVFHVVLKDRKGSDCKISSFGANLYARTNKGINFEQYKTIGGLQKALINLIDKKVDTIGTITFSMSNEVYTF